MLNMRMMFAGIVLLISSAALAREDIISANHVDAVQLGEDASEGRACGNNCNDKQLDTVVEGTVVGGPHSHVWSTDDLDWLAMLGSFPVVALQIVNLILLILVLVHVKGDKGEDTAPAYYSSYAAADTGYADSSSYTKRSAPESSWSLKGIRESPVVAFLTQVVSEAIDKHSKINKH
ncbi:unnamed protein product [Meganyctiphanes norvegica]|uniref:Uncharacterized protein n=1 Tax=Meganyctiphanes norvegica TaxID=48144 RepID=A0AAV2Q699_MEGNR